MESLTQFIENWGYLAVFLGSLVEGESVILTASALASFGYLSIYKIMMVAFTGSVLADQILFLIGKHYGPAIFDKFPYLKTPANRAFVLLRKYDLWFIISCRFIYGIRTVSAMVIGAANIPLRRYIPLNLLSALIWTVISCTAGYLLGDVMESVIQHFDTIQKYLIIGGIIIGVAVFGVICWHKRQKKI